MKKVGDIMKEAGFNANSKDSVKEAYIKHLIKAATGTTIVTPSEQKEINENPKKVLAIKPAIEQLVFAFDEERAEPDKNKKASTF